MTNCPNCGAPREKMKCDYCGTWLMVADELIEREYIYADDKVIAVVEKVRGLEVEE